VSLPFPCIFPPLFQTGGPAAGGVSLATHSPFGLCHEVPASSIGAPPFLIGEPSFRHLCDGPGALPVRLPTLPSPELAEGLLCEVLRFGAAESLWAPMGRRYVRSFSPTWESGVGFASRGVTLPLGSPVPEGFGGLYRFYLAQE